MKKIESIKNDVHDCEFTPIHAYSAQVPQSFRYRLNVAIAEIIFWAIPTGWIVPRWVSDTLLDAHVLENRVYYTHSTRDTNGELWSHYRSEITFTGELE